eukprot:CAMPEP_0176490624 /NCGR_PEP_ID=MMETSP0200_2-20121128/7973_1 /TAXON_ID=947934 /ORGANISM="Chaetoceros sp., Strain GSL56" /LENGTH=225 /DNA_ID=CAMNT_0017887949 /DNA_START=273 /DNA_END=950 /DNA_ORIENTATION=-
MERTIIELTGCNWKHASTAIQKIRNDSAPAIRNHDELISAICEQVVRDREAESARIIREREAERQRRVENQVYEESTLTVTYEYWSNVDGIKGYVTNFEKLVMPNNLRANGVPLSIWEKVFVESVNLLQENRFYTWYKVEGLDYIHPRNLLHFTTLVSNFNAKANFLLNPYGILVQVGHKFKPVELKIVKSNGVIDERRTKSLEKCLEFTVKFVPILFCLYPQFL